MTNATFILTSDVQESQSRKSTLSLQMLMNCGKGKSFTSTLPYGSENFTGSTVSVTWASGDSAFSSRQLVSHSRTAGPKLVLASMRWSWDRAIVSQPNSSCCPKIPINACGWTERIRRTPSLEPVITVSSSTLTIASTELGCPTSNQFHLTVMINVLSAEGWESHPVEIIREDSLQTLSDITIARYICECMLDDASLLLNTLLPGNRSL